MSVTFRKLQAHVGGEVSAIDLRQVHDRATFETLRAGMDAHGVLVFRNQPFTDAEHGLYIFGSSGESVGRFQ